MLYTLAIMIVITVADYLFIKYDSVQLDNNDNSF